nr:TraX family protein [[Eubacterium] cellulosolvens]
MATNLQGSSHRPRAVGGAYETERIIFMKWFFYVYYPLHLIIIGMIRLIVYGNVNICL